MTSRTESEPAATPQQATDAIGEATLELLSESDSYSEFLFSRLVALSPRPFAGRVLEVGCGIGNLTRILLRHSGISFVHAVDLESAYVDRLRREIDDSRLEAVVADAATYCPERFTSAEAGFDFVFSTNVLEHIEDDGAVMRHVESLLRPGGVALILVPAHPFLFGSLDENLSHFRRYSRARLRAVAEDAGLVTSRLRYFNPVGTFGWWLNCKVLKRSMLPSGQVKLYARYGVGLSRLADRINPFPLGISLIGVFEKKA